MEEPTLNAKEIGLLKAAQENNLPLLKTWLKRGVDINCHVDGETALHIAARCGYEELVKQLVKSKKAKINARAMCGQTPLLVAVKTRHMKVVKILITHGADVNCIDSMDKTPLHAAAFNKSVGMVKHLVKNGANVCAVDVFGNTPLAISILDRPSPEIARFLLRHGANKERMNARGTSILIDALLGATTDIDMDVLDLLIRYGMDVNMRDLVGLRTPLHFAVIANNKPVARRLLEAGADPLLRNCFRQTPAQLANRYKHYELLDVIGEFLPDDFVVVDKNSPISTYDQVDFPDRNHSPIFEGRSEDQMEN